MEKSVPVNDVMKGIRLMVSVKTWVKGAKPWQSAVDVAQSVIADRFGTVWRYLKLAAKNPDRDMEYLHQLRIATRRAEAAVEVFRALARKKHRRQLVRPLRQLRQVTGEARDLDVLCERLKQHGNHEHADRLSEAIGRVTDRRRELQPPLVEAYRQVKRDGCTRRVKKLARRRLWRDPHSKQPFRDVARDVLGHVVEDFFRAAQADLSDMEALHGLRICGKQLRYTMEVVACAFDNALRKEVYPEFAEVQKRIGVVIDHTTAAMIYWGWFDQAKGQEYGQVFRSLMLDEQKRAEAARGEFLQWWTAERSHELARRFQQLRAPLTAHCQAELEVVPPRCQADEGTYVAVSSSATGT